MKDTRLDSSTDFVQAIRSALESKGFKDYFFEQYRHTPHIKQERAFQLALLRELNLSECIGVFSEVRYRDGEDKNSKGPPPKADLALVKKLPGNVPEPRKLLAHPSANDEKKWIASHAEIKYHYLSDLIKRRASVKQELANDMNRDPDIFIHVIADRSGIEPQFLFHGILSIPYSKEEPKGENRNTALKKLEEIYFGDMGTEKNAGWNRNYGLVHAESISPVENLPRVPSLRLLCSVFIKKELEGGALPFISADDWRKTWN